MGELKVFGLNSAKEWDQSLREAQIEDIYYSSLYANMLEANCDGMAKLAVYRTAEGIVVYPFLIRNISIYGINTEYNDIVSPYGYAGPIAKGAPNICMAKLVNEFRNCLTEYYHNERVVSEFIRFNPIYDNAELMHRFMNIQYVRDTIYVDMKTSLEMIWESSVQSKTRNMIRKAMKSGVAVTEHGGEALSEFKLLYHLTMDRVHAEKYYYFSDAYFSNLKSVVDFQGVVLKALFEGKVIASIVVLASGICAHYHLSASDPAFRTIPATDLLIWEAIRWSKLHGASYLHLGGGYSGNDDSLFRFKAGFSQMKAKFHIGKAIVSSEIYDELVSVTGTSEKDYFPKYRA